MKSALLLGSYGQSNLGDDILMLVYLNLLRQLGFAKIMANVSDQQNVPSYVKSKFPQVEYFETYRTSALKFMRMLRSADAVFYGGGSVYKELYQSTGRGQYSVILRVLVFNLLAFILGKKIINLNIGAGPLKTFIGRMVSRLSLMFCAYTIFRDRQSLETMGLTENQRYCVSHDGLFDDPNRLVELSASEIPLPRIGKKTIGVNLLSDIPDWVDREKYLEASRKFLNHVSKSHALVLIPFQSKFNKNNDFLFLKSQILPFMENSDVVLLNEVQIQQLGSLYRKFDYFIGMRFHSILLAAIFKVPFLALDYDVKVSNFLTAINYPHALNLKEISLPKLVEIFSKLEGDAAIKEKLSRIYAEFHQDKRCVNNLFSILNVPIQ